VNRAAANKYQNDIRTVSDAGRRLDVAENCQKLQSVVDTLMMCQTEYHTNRTSGLGEQWRLQLGMG